MHIIYKWFNHSYNWSSDLIETLDAPVTVLISNTVIRRKFWRPQTLYTDVRKIPDFTKQAQVS